jgi:hypothetical protein
VLSCCISLDCACWAVARRFSRSGWKEGREEHCDARVFAAAQMGYFLARSAQSKTADAQNDL